MKRLLPFSFSHARSLNRVLRLFLTGSVIWIGGQVASSAVSTSRFVHEGRSDFSDGERTGLALSSFGELRTAASLSRETSFPGSTILWNVVFGPNDTIHAVTGNPGALFLVAKDEEGDAEVRKRFDPRQSLVRALAMNPGEDLFIGTSPAGRVYRLREGADYPEVYFAPGVRYIWNLVEGPDGDIWMTTGEPARVYRLPADGSAPPSEPWFEAEETHLMSIAFGEDGKVILGTANPGRLYRVDAEGEGAVVVDMDQGEISRVQPGPDGDLFFSVISPDPPGGSNRQRSDRGNHLPRHGLFRLAADGFVHQVWTLPDVRIYDFAPSEDGWLVATGPDAVLYRVRDPFHWEELSRLETGGDLNRLFHNGDSWWVAGSNPAALYRLEEPRRGSGNYQSKVLDAGQRVHWGRIRLNGGDTEKFEIETRLGNTSQPGPSWSEWGDPSETPGSRSPARFAQYRITVPEEAVLRRVELFYQLPNQAPVFGEVKVIPYALQPMPKPPEQPRRMTMQQILSGEEGSAAQQSHQPLVFVEEPSSKTVVWEAGDPNEDPLEFTVYLRDINSEDWILLSDSQPEPFYTLSTAGMEEGFYQFRIRASDRPGNPAGMEQVAETTSPNFLIDSTPPRIEARFSEQPGRHMRVFVRVEDNFGIIRSLSYRLNGAPGRRVIPEDGMYDSRRENFIIDLPSLPPGTHSLILKAEDENGNRANRPYTFEIKR